MGLKTTNYEIKSTGQFLSTAYAIIRNLEIHGSCGKAEFVIQTSREMTSKKQPIEKFYIDFYVNRNENPYVTAYNVAKGTTKKLVKVNVEDKLTGKKKIKNVEKNVPNRLYGWEDDIVASTSSVDMDDKETKIQNGEKETSNPLD